MQQAIMVLFMMVAAFIGLYFVTSRLVLQPIDELRSAAGAVSKGDFNYPSRCPTPAGGPATGWRAHRRVRPMARDLEALYAAWRGQVRSKTDDLMVLNDMLNYQKRELKVAVVRVMRGPTRTSSSPSSATSCARRSPAFGLRAILNADDSLAPKTREAVGEIESNATPFAEHSEQHPRHFKHAAKKDELLPEPWISSIWPSSCARRWSLSWKARMTRLSCSVAPDVPLEHGRLGEAAPHFGEPGEQCYQVHPSRRVRALTIG